MRERNLDERVPGDVMSSFPRRFGSRYVLLKQLGRGGMGQVFMALGGGGRVCAIKTLPSSEVDPEIVVRLQQEARLLTQLSHANLVFVFETGRAGADRFLAMEYIRGKTLFDVRVRLGKLRQAMPVGLALVTVRELLRGLAYVHGLGGLSIVHRDVAPTNVMIAYEGSVKLIDFGIAKSAFQIGQTASGLDWGQKSYQSPEQLSGKKLDARSDIFSAGVILWELLTGQSLFGKDVPRSLEAPIPAPSKVVPELSRQLDALVLTALACDPSDRYRSAAEFADALSENLTIEYDSVRLKAFMADLFGQDAAREAAEERTLVAAIPVTMLPPEGSEAHQAPATAGITAPMTGRSRLSRWSRPMVLVAALLLSGGGFAWLESRTADDVNRLSPPSSVVSKTPSSPHVPIDPEMNVPSETPKAIPTLAETSVGSPRTTPAVRNEPRPKPEATAMKTANPEEVSGSAPTPQELMDRAETAYQTRRLLEALHSARAAVGAAPSLDAHLMLGKIYIQMERYREALQHYDAALNLSPSNVAAQKGRAMAAERVR